MLLCYYCRVKFVTPLGLTDSISLDPSEFLSRVCITKPAAPHGVLWTEHFIFSLFSCACVIILSRVYVVIAIKKKDEKFFVRQTRRRSFTLSYRTKSER